MATKKTGGKSLGDMAVSAKANRKVLVRMKPFAPRKGQPCERYNAFGILFEERKGWYAVDQHVADYLVGVRARPDVEDHPVMLFDVCTPDEAEKICEEENETAMRAGRAAPHAAHRTISARDVTTGSQMGPRDPAPPAAFVASSDLTTKDLAKKDPTRAIARPKAPKAPAPPPRDIPERSMRAPKPAEE
jgi:hypothetical protein